MNAWVRALAVAAVLAAAHAFADEHPRDDGKLFNLVCVEWSDAGVTAAAVSDPDGGVPASDGGAQERCVKYEAPYGCSSVGGGMLGALALVGLVRRKSPSPADRERATRADGSGG